MCLLSLSLSLSLPDGSGSQALNEPFVDQVATIHPVLVHADASATCSHDERAPAPAKRPRLMAETAAECVVCYCCRLADVPGRFDSAKATALGVPKDKRRADLTKGESITLDDGTVINPSDVVSGEEHTYIDRIHSTPRPFDPRLSFGLLEARSATALLAPSS